MRPDGTATKQRQKGKVFLLLGVSTAISLLVLRPALAQASAHQSPVTNPAVPEESTAPTAQNFLQQGNEAARLNKWDLAIAAYKKALSLKPDYVEAHYNLGNAYAAEQKTSEALKEYRAVLRLRPEFPGVHRNIGALEEAAGAIPEAITEYRAETSAHPNNADAHVNLANALTANRAFSEAAAEYRTALALAPRDAEVRKSVV